MRVEIDRYGDRFVIDSFDLKLISLWVAEHVPMLLSHDLTMGPAKLTVYPSTQEEAKQIGHPAPVVTEDGLRKLAEILNSAADRMQLQREGTRL